MTTQTGRIVYDRPKNHFGYKDVERIIKATGAEFSEKDCYRLIDLAIKNLFDFWEDQIEEALMDLLRIVWQLVVNFYILG